MRTLARAIAVAVLAVPALAGPPLVCHPWIANDATPPAGRTWLGPDGAVAGDPDIVKALDLASETLVRMDIVQRVLAARGAKASGFVDALAERVKRLEDATRGEAAPSDARRTLARARFDHALASATAHYLGGERASAEEEGASVARLKTAADALEADAAARLAVARATTPLMRTGTREEHARAFVAAFDLASTMPEGEARSRLRAVLAWDLEHLEAYLLDGEIRGSGATPSAETRLARLRSIAAAQAAGGDAK